MSRYALMFRLHQRVGETKKIAVVSTRRIVRRQNVPGFEAPANARAVGFQA